MNPYGDALNFVPYQQGTIIAISLSVDLLTVGRNLTKSEAGSRLNKLRYGTYITLYHNDTTNIIYHVTGNNDPSALKNLTWGVENRFGHFE